MNDEELLRVEYEALLRGEGRSLWRPSEEDVAVLGSTMTAEERIFFGGSPHSAGVAKAVDPFQGALSDLQQALHKAGFSLLEAVHVAVYPHESFNAQARAIRGGTLILINTGFTVLVLEIAKTFAASMGFFDRDEDGGITVADPTAVEQERKQLAEAAMARSLLAYLLQGDARYGGRQPLHMESVGMAWRLTDATTRFVIAHELAHLVEGHLATPQEREAGRWLSRTRKQEFQADQTGALLALRALENPTDQILNHFAVAGPLFFFAIDHLISRVRNEIDDIPQGMRLSDHPGSDERGAALRALFQDIHGPLVLQLADACVHWLAWHEDGIIAATDRLVQV